MIFKHLKRVTFLCPAVTTGGPEAIHQASQALNRNGLSSDIAYYGDDARVTLADGRLTCDPPADNPCLTAYGDYEPTVCRTALLRPHHLVVLPEVLADSFAAFGRARVAVWWLSVDNALPSLDQLKLRALVNDRSVTHLHQSAYAADFLRRIGVATSHPLSDFTTAEFTSITAVGPNPGPAIAYNPAKGAELAEQFFISAPQLLREPIRGMGRVQTAEVLRATTVYIDFGHFPGKDRLPREAAASGCVVFVRDAGAGHYREDFAIPDFFRFTDDDVASGELLRRVTAVHADPAPMFAQQQPLRDDIAAERDDLDLQVRTLLGRSRAA